MYALKNHGLIALAAAMLTVTAAAPQEYGSRLGTQRGGAVSFEPKGPGVLFGALDPSVKKWYIPQELFTDYGWRQWQYSNYAKDEFRRYVNIHREGDYFYDFYGNYVCN